MICFDILQRKLQSFYISVKIHSAVSMMKKIADQEFINRNWGVPLIVNLQVKFECYNHSTVIPKFLLIALININQQGYSSP